MLQRAFRFTARFDVREKPPRPEKDQQIGYDGKKHRGNHIIVITAGEDQKQRHRYVLHNGNAGVDIGENIITVMDAQNTSAIGEKEISDGCIEEMDEIKHVDVDVRRHLSVNEPTDERQKAKPDPEDADPDPVVKRPIKTQAGAYLLPVVPRYQFEHGTPYGGAETEFRQAQDSEDRSEKPIQPQIIRTEQPEEKRPVQEREQHLEYLIDALRDNVSFRILNKIQLHSF